MRIAIMDLGNPSEGEIPRAFLGARVLGHYREQASKGISEINPLSDASVAMFQRDIGTLIESPSPFMTQEHFLALIPGSNSIDRSYVSQVLPGVIRRLEKEGYLARNSNDSYSLPRV